MDISLYRDEEQFSFSSTTFMENYTNDSASIDVIHNFTQSEFFESLEELRQPQGEMFDWNNDTERELNGDLAVIPSGGGVCNIEGNLSVSPPSKGDFHKLLGWQNWQPIWQPMLNTGADSLAIGDTVIPPEDDIIGNHKNNASLQEILDLPEIATNKLQNRFSKVIVKIEPDYENRISESSDDSSLTETDRTRISEPSDILNSNLYETDITNFDIAEYVFEENKQSKQSIKIKQEPVDVKPEVEKRQIKAGVKKIDLKAQKYIIGENDIKKSFSEDECDVDIETVSEEESAPVLEAGDLTSLLEQFEATEVKNIKHNFSVHVKVEVKGDQETTSDDSNLSHHATEEKQKIKANNKDKFIGNIKVKQEKKPISEISKKNPENTIVPTKLTTDIIVKSEEPTTSSQAHLVSNNKLIIDSLPQELINRIKESGKRKPITVIQPIPNNKKRSKIQEITKPVPSSSPDTVYLDHNYCSVLSNQVYKKDSGFVSSEEDDRAIISRQPTVKNADGTLMVSLLKANTIRHVESINNQKKKLNLEEYKKRRKGFLTPNNSSQNCSPNTSNCSSPLPEDEQQKMLKHQEKLRKMAEEVLNAAPKSEKKFDPIASPIKMPLLIAISPLASPAISSTPASPVVKTEHLPVIPVEVPPNLERKVLVSFGVNTDFKIAKDEDPLAPVVKLEEMKPLLQKVSDKISENSLIASVIENIPKIINKNDKHKIKAEYENESQYEHGENKQVLHLERDRVKCEVKDAETQTNVSLIEQTKRGRVRRRISSSSSCSSYKSLQSSASRRSRKCSDSSSSSRRSYSSRRSTSSSRSSDYSSRLCYSRSRSRSPRYSKTRRNSSAEREHLSAVEERRIIYVGRIPLDATQEDLRIKFQKFGPINKITLHFRDIGENYGFVTFKYKEDAHEAYEHGNDDLAHPCYKISFGGRREFCKAAYSDLDNMRDESYYQSQNAEDSFDKLLREAQEKLRKRKA